MPNDSKQPEQRRFDGGEDLGHRADSPKEVPARGWAQVLKRSVAQIKADHLPLVAAGVAFFFLLGLFPGLAAIISIYGWLADPQTVARHIEQLSGVLPEQAVNIVHNQAQQLAAEDAGAGWGALIGILLALWAGSKAMKGMVQALNIAYSEEEDRRFIKKQAVYLGLTLLTVISGVLAILLVAIAPAVVGFLPIPGWAEQLILWLRWPLLLLVGMSAIAAMYRYGPARAKAQWRWISWGAGGATVLWVIASTLFSLYVSKFGNFNETYGSLGAVVVLMLWLYLTAFLIIMGAEVDAELEHQTRHDTTTGEEQPLGSRDAFVADNVVQE